MGIRLYGHGANTVLKYDGQPGEVMLRLRGVLRYRIESFVFDGNDRARVGMYHDNRFPDKMLFETHFYPPYSAAKIEMNRIEYADRIGGALEDLRKLGAVDWQLNYPELL